MAPARSQMQGSLPIRIYLVYISANSKKWFDYSSVSLLRCMMKGSGRIVLCGSKVNERGSRMGWKKQFTRLKWNRACAEVLRICGGSKSPQGHRCKCCRFNTRQQQVQEEGSRTFELCRTTCFSPVDHVRRTPLAQVSVSRISRLLCAFLQTSPARKHLPRPCAGCARYAVKPAALQDT